MKSLRNVSLCVLTAAMVSCVCFQALAGESKPAKETVAVIKTTQGDVTVRFFLDKAPEHVKNFLSHAKSGYYKKTYFHRVFPDFMIQGGDPNTKDEDPSNDGGGGYSYKGKNTMLKAEFNDMPHLRGVLSMARSQDPNSAGSQFFIMVRDNPALDGQYSGFGRVIRGLDVVDKIVVQPGTPIPGAGGFNPTVHQFIEDITIEEWNTDDVYMAEAKLYGHAKCLVQPMVVMETTQGEIGFALMGDKAPEHVRNFLEHCRSGFYEGTYFHRIVSGFMVQGGDPNTKNEDPSDDGMGGWSCKGKDTFMKAEFNDVKHVRGILSMARANDPDSAGSQFFIMVADKPDLDGKYTAFGRVAYGMDAVDRMVKVAVEEKPDGGDVNPSTRQLVQKVRVDWVSLKQILNAAAEAEKHKIAEAIKAPKGKQYVAILETTQGTIYISFFPDKAPIHVHNFMEHCKSGYYTGTYFHRVFKGFMIQGGDPNTKDDDPSNDGQGGFSYKGENTYLTAEFNDVPHVRGVLSMARSQDPNSAGSQFFIMLAANNGLDGKYSAFGKVISGMSVVDKIVSQPGKEIPGAGGVNPTQHQLVKKATIELWTDKQVAQYERKKN